MITTERLTRHYAPGLAAPCALLLLLLCAAATEVRADPVVITFDEPGMVGHSDFRDRFGVFFSTAHTRNGQIVNLTDAVIANSAAANTAPNALFGAQLNPLALRYNNVSVEFILPIPGAPFLYSRAATDFV
ncbi:MAG: hypothetical protein LC746_11920, partial [Acidobacteria bacterium]|nr:hypothetical protein [Acidobacteriota bacterium]